jgi:hypothetical protein
VRFCRNERHTSAFVTSRWSPRLQRFRSSARGIHKRAEIRSDEKSKIFKNAVIRMAAIIEGKIMNLSVEAKVAIAVATSLVVLIVGAMAQG